MEAAGGRGWGGEGRWGREAGVRVRVRVGVWATHPGCDPQQGLGSLHEAHGVQGGPREACAK